MLYASLVIIQYLTNRLGDRFDKDLMMDLNEYYTSNDRFVSIHLALCKWWVCIRSASPDLPSYIRTPTTREAVGTFDRYRAAYAALSSLTTIDTFALDTPAATRPHQYLPASLTEYLFLYNQERRACISRVNLSLRHCPDTEWRDNV